VGGKVGGATGGAVLGPAPGGAALLLLAPAEAAAMAKPSVTGTSGSSRLSC